MIFSFNLQLKYNVSKFFSCQSCLSCQFYLCKSVVSVSSVFLLFYHRLSLTYSFIILVGYWIFIFLTTKPQRHEEKYNFFYLCKSVVSVSSVFYFLRVIYFMILYLCIFLIKPCLLNSSFCAVLV